MELATATLQADLQDSKGKIRIGTVYYGVHTPNDTDGQANVFEDKEAALKLAKKNKKSRFKAFQFYHEAVEFSVNGYEFPNNNSSIEGLLFEKRDSVLGFGEKASPFKGPKPQELVELRKGIESGNINQVRNAIWMNPRLLVSSGDTPSILQEGARLNALHVAARAKNAAMTELILNTVTDPEFIKRLYGDDNQENAEERCKILLDLYLNTPNKGLNETPLHIAAKWGAAEVVEILVSYPQCSTTKKNKHFKTPEDVNCERVDGKVPASVEKKIGILLGGNFYVPVLRTEDNTLPPLIGEPFCPTDPPVLNKDPLSPRMEIHAYAGPMDKKGADSFRKIWKTPPRSLNICSPNGTKTPNDNLASLKLKDPQKGLEKIGKRIAKNFNVCWKEYWPFLDSFVDISSEEGLELLEKHLASRQKDMDCSPLAMSAKPEDIVSPISSLCAAFSAFKINDSSMLNESGDRRNDFDSLVYVDKACQVFANRILNSISFALYCNEHEYDSSLKNLEYDVKQLELLMNSYMDDDRFSNGVNFQKIHPRLNVLIGQKLYVNVRDTDGSVLVGKIERILDSVVKMLDCFSSDDEGQNFNQFKPTTYRRQLICLVSGIINVLSQSLSSQNNNKPKTEDTDVKVCWSTLDECACVYHVRKPKKGSLSRSGSFKNQSRHVKVDLQNVPKRLFSGDDAGGTEHLNGDVDYSSESEEEFFTPPSSPSLILSDSDSEDEFNDTHLPTRDLYLEGECPTRTDCAVFNALQYAECQIDRKKYPNVYKWHHCVNLYLERERESWPSPRIAKLATPSIVSPPPKPVTTSTPSKAPWLRVTGVNSPRAAFKSYNSH